MTVNFVLNKDRLVSSWKLGLARRSADGPAVATDLIYLGLEVHRKTTYSDVRRSPLSTDFLLHGSAQP